MAFNSKKKSKTTDNSSGIVIEKTDLNNKNIKNNQVKGFLTIIFFIPLIGGLWAINYWLSDYNLAKDTLNWQSYPGVIIKKSIGSDRSTGVSGTQISGRSYHPEVEYHFTYQDKKYKSDNIDFLNTPAYGDIKIPQAFLNSLPSEGDYVDVFYNPELKKSVLITGANNSSYFGISIGVVFFLLALVGFKYIYT